MNNQPTIADCPYMLLVCQREDVVQYSVDYRQPLERIALDRVSPPIQRRPRRDDLKRIGAPGWEQARNTARNNATAAESHHSHPRRDGLDETIELADESLCIAVGVGPPCSQRNATARQICRSHWTTSRSHRIARAHCALHSATSVDNRVIYRARSGRTTHRKPAQGTPQYDERNRPRTTNNDTTA